uniref:Uncharacterized protein n=1 Tax=Glossina pallidipes TaxID=7398 RepID=A0A1A9ZSL4_GLOPL
MYGWMVKDERYHNATIHTARNISLAVILSYRCRIYLCCGLHDGHASLPLLPIFPLRYDSIFKLLPCYCIERIASFCGFVNCIECKQIISYSLPPFSLVFSMSCCRKLESFKGAIHFFTYRHRDGRPAQLRWLLIKKEYLANGMRFASRSMISLAIIRQLINARPTVTRKFTAEDLSDIVNAYMDSSN